MTEFTSHSVQETEQFAAHCAAKLRAGDVLACRGGMGMGKTAFARGLARGLGLSDEVSSPTFALVQECRDAGFITLRDMATHTEAKVRLEEVVGELGRAIL